MTPENVPSDSPKEVYEVYFVFACIWAFGGTLLQDQVCQLWKFKIARIIIMNAVSLGVLIFKESSKLTAFIMIILAILNFHN